MTNLSSILKSRDITLPTKFCLAWMWELDYKESWELNNWCFWTVVLEKTLESPLDCKEIKPVSPKWMVNQKLHYFGYLMGRANSLEKTLMLGKIEGKKKRAWQRVRSLNGITDSMDEFEQTLGNREGQGSLACCQSMGFQRMRPDLATEQQHLLQSFGRYIYFCHLVHQWNTHN